MPGLELSQPAQQWTNLVLLWLGFGILAGLLAKALLPGRRPAGAMGTLVVGIVGSTLGLLALTMLLKTRDLNPVSPLGILSAVGGAVVSLIFYRLLAHRFAPDLDDDGD